IQASPTMPSSSNVIETANYQTLKGTTGQTGQPSYYGLQDLTVDGNVANRGTYSSTSLQGHCFASHGILFSIRRVDFINAPQDGAYSEGPGAVGGTGVGNLSFWEYVRPHH